MTGLVSSGTGLVLRYEKNSTVSWKSSYNLIFKKLIYFMNRTYDDYRVSFKFLVDHDDTLEGSTQNCASEMVGTVRSAFFN